LANASGRRCAIKAICIAGAGSGSGKTTLTLALIASLKHKGYRVAAFKIGPDFIDPGHHARLTGKPARNLDGWMLTRDANLACFQQHAQAVDIAVVEGVMGLFDGYDGKTEAGSTAQMAKWLGLPVILIVSAKSMARSAAALVQGFERFDPDLHFAGVIFNHVASPRHLQYLADALEGHVTMPLLGGIPVSPEIQIPERHLGLFTAESHPLDQTHVDRLAALLEKSVDIDRMIADLPDVVLPRVHIEPALISQPILTGPVRIGVAKDTAFCFYYSDNLDSLEAAGAQLIPFSPLTDQKLPENIDGLYLGGGYPEMFGKQLSGNMALRQEIAEKRQDNMPIYGECGGFMYLCRDLTDMTGERHDMVGCFPFSIRMLPRLKSLGYREIQLQADCLLGQTGQTLRGHEFHYSEIVSPAADIPTRYITTRRDGQPSASEGYQVHQTLGSYIHLHFGSNQFATSSFVAACHHYHQNRIQS
jgi:cobyrinic acid a,c-diamide synthase